MVQLAQDWRKADLSEQDYAMLEYAEKITLAPDTCSEDDIRHLREVGFTDEDIFDIVMLAAYRNFIVRVADALGVRLKGELLHDKRIVEALSTGKRAEDISVFE